MENIWTSTVDCGFCETTITLASTETWGTASILKTDEFPEHMCYKCATRSMAALCGLQEQPPHPTFVLSTVGLIPFLLSNSYCGENNFLHLFPVQFCKHIYHIHLGMWQYCKKSFWSTNRDYLLYKTFL